MPHTAQVQSHTGLTAAFSDGGRVRQRLKRALLGGTLRDTGRLPRYIGVVALGLTAVWAPIVGYLKTAPLSYTSHMSLILPGSGSSATVNLADIGQVSSYANSAFASSAISPTETYKRLLSADRVLRDAAARLGLTRAAFGKPRVSLVDQTAFIHVEMKGPSPDAAQARSSALMAAFQAEISRLRQDEQDSRHTGGLSAIREYKTSVAATRADIARLQRLTGLQSAEQFGKQVDQQDALAGEIDRITAEYETKTAFVLQLERQLGSNAREAALILELNGDSSYLALLENMAAAAADLAAADAEYGQQHPVVRAARTALNAARDQAQAHVAALTDAPIALERAIDGGRAALLADLVRAASERKGLEARLDQLRAQHAEHSERIRRLAPLAAQLEDLQRDFNVAEAVFASAIARAQSSKTDIYASYPLVQVLEDPTLPDAPSSPRRKLAIAAGGAASFMLFMALVLAWMRRAVILRLIDVRRSGA